MLLAGYSKFMDQSTSFSAFLLVIVSSWIRAPLLVLLPGYIVSSWIRAPLSMLFTGYSKFMDQSTSLSAFGWL